MPAGLWGEKQLGIAVKSTVPVPEINSSAGTALQQQQILVARVPAEESINANFSCECLKHGLPPLQALHCIMAALCAHFGAGSVVRLQLYPMQAWHPGSQRCRAACIHAGMLLAGGSLMILITMTIGELVSAFPMSELA